MTLRVRSTDQGSLQELSVPVVWIGAKSFEERCYASLRRLANAHIRVDKVVVFEYSTRVITQHGDMTKREQNYGEILWAANELGAEVQLREVSAYAYADVAKNLNQEREAGTFYLCDKNSRDGSRILDSPRYEVISETRSFYLLLITG